MTALPLKTVPGIVSTNPLESGINTMKELALSDMLVMLRRELQEAQQKAANENLKFKLEDIEVEVNFILSQEGAGGFKAKVMVFGSELGAEVGGKITAQTIHKIKLKMRPELNGGDVQISDEIIRP